MNVGVVLRHDLLIFKGEWAIRVPLADRVVSQQTEVKHSIVVHYHSIRLKSFDADANKMKKKTIFFNEFINCAIVKRRADYLRRF